MPQLQEDEIHTKLPKASKGIVISVINQTNSPLSLNGVKVAHGKIFAKPGKVLASKEATKFALEGERSIEARFKYKWDTKGFIELYCKYPKGGEGSASAYVERKIATKIQVYIPTIAWDRITNVSFILDEDHTPQQQQSGSSFAASSEQLHEKPTTRARSASAAPAFEMSSIGGLDSAREASKSERHSIEEDENSENLSDSMSTSSMGDWSSDEEDAPAKKTLNVVIKPRSESTSSNHIPTLALANGLPPSRSFVRKRNIPADNQSSQPEASLKHSTSDTSIQESPSKAEALSEHESKAVGSGSAMDLLFGQPKGASLVKEWSIGKLLGLNSESEGKVAAMEFMKLAFVDLQVGHFDTSLNYISKAISALAPIQSFQKELRYCAQYKVALRLLVKINSPDTSAKQGAFLSWILSSLCLRPNHRVICIRMAIKKNIQVGNYGVAYDLIKYLQERVKPVDVDTINARLSFCEQKNKTNADERFSYDGFEYNVGHPLLFCAKTFELITKKSYLGCRVCSIFYAPSVSSVGAKCTQCELGSLELRFGI